MMWTYAIYIILLSRVIESKNERWRWTQSEEEIDFFSGPTGPPGVVVMNMDPEASDYNDHGDQDKKGEWDTSLIGAEATYDEDSSFKLECQVC